MKRLSLIGAVAALTMSSAVTADAQDTAGGVEREYRTPQPTSGETFPGQGLASAASPEVVPPAKSQDLSVKLQKARAAYVVELLKLEAAIDLPIREDVSENSITLNGTHDETALFTDLLYKLDRPGVPVIRAIDGKVLTETRILPVLKGADRLIPDEGEQGDLAELDRKSSHLLLRGRPEAIERYLAWIRKLGEDVAVLETAVWQTTDRETADALSQAAVEQTGLTLVEEQTGLTVAEVRKTATSRGSKIIVSRLFIRGQSLDLDRFASRVRDEKWDAVRIPITHALPWSPSDSPDYQGPKEPNPVHPPGHGPVPSTGAAPDTLLDTVSEASSSGDDARDLSSGGKAAVIPLGESAATLREAVGLLPSATLDELQQEQQRLEDQAARVAAYLQSRKKARDNLEQLYQMSQATPPDFTPLGFRKSENETKRLQDLLKRLVGAAFDTRQRLQQAEVAERREQLQRIEQSIQSNERSREEIIEQRVKELLDPGLLWESDKPSETPFPYGAVDPKAPKHWSFTVTKGDDLSAILGAIIQEEFEKRQELLREELETLRKRLDAIEKKIASRGAAVKEMVGQRLEELLKERFQAPNDRLLTSAQELSYLYTKEGGESKTEEEASKLDTPQDGTQPTNAELEATIWRTFGARVRPVTKVGMAGNRYNGGMVIRDVRQHGQAANAGLQQGDIIIGVGKWETVSLENLHFALTSVEAAGDSESGDRNVKLLFLRKSGLLYTMVTLGSSQLPLLDDGGVMPPDQPEKRASAPPSPAANPSTAVVWVEALFEGQSDKLQTEAAYMNGTVDSADGLIAVALSPESDQARRLKSARVYLDAGKVVGGQLVAYDAGSGLGLLRAEARDLPFLSPANDLPAANQRLSMYTMQVSASGQKDRNRQDVRVERWDDRRNPPRFTLAHSPGNGLVRPTDAGAALVAGGGELEGIVAAVDAKKRDDGQSSVKILPATLIQKLLDGDWSSSVSPAAPPTTERKDEKSPIDKSSLNKVSKEFNVETRVANGLVTGGGVIERIEDDTIHLTSGDSVVSDEDTLIIMRAGYRIRLVLDWLKPGMAINYSIKDGKVQTVRLAGIVEPEPNGNDPFERIKDLELRKGGHVTDSVDGRHPIRVVGSDGEVLVKLGENKLIRMPKPTTSIEWRSGDFTPETIDDVEPFDHVLVQWRANGRITWTFYQSPSKAIQSQTP